MPKFLDPVQWYNSDGLLLTPITPPTSLSDTFRFLGIDANTYIPGWYYKSWRLCLGNATLFYSSENASRICQIYGWFPLPYDTTEPTFSSQDIYDAWYGKLYYPVPVSGYDYGMPPNVTYKFPCSLYVESGNNFIIKIIDFTNKTETQISAPVSEAHFSIQQLSF